jgi:hypothetical protein
MLGFFTLSHLVPLANEPGLGPIRDLSELNRCGWCTSSCKAHLLVETETLTLRNGEEAEINLGIEPDSWLLGKIQLVDMEVSTEGMKGEVLVGDCLVWRDGTTEGCLHYTAPWKNLTLERPGSNPSSALSATIPIRVLKADPPQDFTATLIFHIAIGNQTPPCTDHQLQKQATVRFTVVAGEIRESGVRLALSLLFLSVPALGTGRTRTQPPSPWWLV